MSALTGYYVNPVPTEKNWGTRILAAVIAVCGMIGAGIKFLREVSSTIKGIVARLNAQDDLIERNRLAIESGQQENLRLQGEIETLHNELLEANESCRGLTRQNFDQESRITKLEKELSDKTAELDRVNAALTEKTAEALSLAAERDRLQALLDERKS